MADHQKNIVSGVRVEAKPVLEKLAGPGYPKRDEGHSVTARWGKVASGAATFFLAINIGGVGESRATAMPLIPPPQAPLATNQAPATPTDNTKPQNPNAMIVAPLFEHGEGRGATGCVVTTPPVFLSEEEAMLIIKEELGKYGIKLEPGSELKDIVIEMPMMGVFPSRTNAIDQKKNDDPKPLDVDAIDQEKHIVIEFVSKDDHEKLRAKSRFRTSMTSYDVKKVAQNLTEATIGKGESTRYFGVFYDPMAKLAFQGMPMRGRMVVPNPEPEKKPGEEPKKLSFEERTEQAQKETKKLLRQQVTDFADWLETQGVKLSKPKQPAEKEQPTAKK